MLIEFLKTVIAKISHVLLHVMYIFPMKNNRILFFPTNGHYYCNLKYLDEYIRLQESQLELIWICKQMNDASYPSGVKKVEQKSFSFLYYFFTSKVIIFNNWIPSWLTKRDDQIFINTWHGGGAYKKVDTVFINNPNTWQRKRCYYIFNQIDYLVSACGGFTGAFEAEVCIPAKYLPIGMPRNDVFFDKDTMNQKSDKVRQFYNVPRVWGIVIYAPTFRNDGMKLDLDVEMLLTSLEERFHKKFVLFERSHPHPAGVYTDIFAENSGNAKVIDVSGYADMQELLCTADVLITDYSSLIWDVSFAGHPCFIYANDLLAYKGERNFYTPIEEWPFALAENNIELRNNILSFDDESYKRKVEEHHIKLGSYETGHASEALYKLLLTLCREG